MIPSTTKSIKLAIDEPHKVNYYFTVKGINKVWNESKGSSNTIKVEMPIMKNLLGEEEFINPFLMKEGKAGILFLASKREDDVKIYSFNNLDKKLISNFKVVAGKNIYKIAEDISSLAKIVVLFQSNHIEYECQLKK